MSGGKSKSKGTARSQASINHGAANSREQGKENTEQVRALAAKRAEELYRIRPAQAIAREVRLGLQVADAKNREEEERQVQSLDLAFNFAPDGTEISDAEDKRRVREQEKVQFYWQARGASRSGKWRSIPLGGQYNNQGQSSECPVWYLASNMTQWDSWAVIDGTRAGLDGKQFLMEVMRRHAAWFADFTKQRLVVGQCHKKPHNIHGQHWFSVVGEEIPDPGKKEARVDQQRPTGLLLGRDDMKGRGKSPMRFAFLGKTGCSLANLRRAGYDINALTGDPHMVEKLDAWIARRKRHGRPVLDMESEKKLEEIVGAVRAQHPEWEPYFVAARDRHQKQQTDLIRLIHEEISKRAPFDAFDLRARTESEETVTGIDEGLSPEAYGEDAKSRCPASGPVKTGSDSPVSLDKRSRVAAMGDALKRTLAGIAPTLLDRFFVIDSPTALGSYALAPHCREELQRALCEPDLAADAERARQLADAAEFTDFEKAAIAFDDDGSDGDAEQRRKHENEVLWIAANAAKTLGLQVEHERYMPSWTTRAKAAMHFLDRLADAGPERPAVDHDRLPND